MRIVLFGDGLWAADTLRLLAGAGHTIAAVVERWVATDDSVAIAARETGTPVLRFQPGQPGRMAAALRVFPADMAVSVSYNLILRRAVLDLYPMGIVNLHAGKLPHYRGRNVINWAILNGESTIGVTAHFIDEGIDTGDIILQEELPIGWCDTYGAVLRRVVEALPQIALRAVTAVADGTAERRPQMPWEGTYYPGRTEADEWIDWSETSLRIYNKIRAITHPAPGAKTLLGDAELRIWSARYEPGWPAYSAAPGRVVGHSPEGAVVKTGDSVIVVTQAQLPGQPPACPAWRTGTDLGMDPAARLHDLTRRILLLEERLGSRPALKAVR